MKTQRQKLFKIMQTALMAALCFIAFRFFRIDVPTLGGSKEAIHLANAFVVLAALQIGPLHGALAGAIGLSLADLLSSYVSSAPKTFILKFCIGMIAGLIAHRLGHINRLKQRSEIFKWVLIAASAALVFNIIFDPLLGYLYKRFIFGLDVTTASILAKWSAGITFINALVSVVVVTIVYMALRTPLEKAGYLD